MSSEVFDMPSFHQNKNLFCVKENEENFNKIMKNNDNDRQIHRQLVK
jgi:hypothetical protein